MGSSYIQDSYLKVAYFSTKHTLPLSGTIAIYISKTIIVYIHLPQIANLLYSRGMVPAHLSTTPLILTNLRTALFLAYNK